MYRTIQSGVNSWVAAGMFSLLILMFFLRLANTCSFGSVL